jgi:5-methylcytosine-specific restriction endonuclease McrA
MVEASEMGRVAGRLDVHIVDGTRVFRDRGERAQVLTIVADHRRQLADIETRTAEDKTDQLRDYYRLRREGLGAAIAREVELARKLPAAISGSWYENRIIPLDDSIPDQRAIALLIAAYNSENARRALAGLPVGIELRDRAVAGATPPPARVGVTPTATTDQPTAYAGSAACAGCHQAAWRVFESTKHAHALAALARVHRDRDPTCVGCHATGFLLPGGTRSIRVATAQLKDVGCESCHGPSLGHVTATAADRKSTTRRQVDEIVCRGCHTPDQTNGEFEYRSFLKAVLGPGHGRS